MGRRAIHRRRFLHGALSYAGVFAAGGSVALAGPANPRRPLHRVRLGYVGNTCEAATFAAPHGAVFAHNGLEPRLLRFANDEALAAALGAGTVDAASTNLPALLRPLETGVDLRVAAGLHSGCLRVLARDAATLISLADLKGQRIATDRHAGPAMNLLSAILRRDGIDPERDVAWRVYDAAALDAALDAKEVACVATADPLGYVLLTAHKAEQYLDTANGGFSCGGDIAPGHHCFLVLNGRLVDTRAAVAAALTRAYLETTAAIGRGVGPAALTGVRGGYAPADMYATLGMLSSYAWTPSVDIVLEELALTARDFRRAGLLKSSTDTQLLADRAFADVLHA
jgi:NitT/TauT family transport system substrate-binding protein